MWGWDVGSRYGDWGGSWDVGLRGVMGWGWVVGLGGSWVGCGAEGRRGAEGGHGFGVGLRVGVVLGCGAGG